MKRSTRPEDQATPKPAAAAAAAAAATTPAKADDESPPAKQPRRSKTPDAAAVAAPKPTKPAAASSPSKMSPQQLVVAAAKQRATTTTAKAPTPTPTPPPPQRPPRAETPETIHKPAAAAAAEEEEKAGDPISGYRVSAENVAQLAARGITAFFPIQSATFNPIYAGHDIVGRALTGSGKTLSFVLPVVERLAAETKGMEWKTSGRLPRVLCLAPTRELARQDAEEFKRCTAHLGMDTVLAYGGVSISAQSSALWRGADIVVGTPGRLNDLIEREALVLSALRTSILDEADEMLSIGFAEEVEKILNKAPTGDAAPQTLLFSATMPGWVQKVAQKFLRPEHDTVDLVGNSGGNKIPEGVVHMALCCVRSSIPEVLRNLLLAPMEGLSKDSRTIVFVSMKRDADSLQAALASSVSCQVIHGNVSQEHRERSLQEFRAGKFAVLVATDVAARGLDIKGVERVINCAPPKDVETYIHRAGRTGRAGKNGFAITCYQRAEALLLRNIEAKTGISFKRIGTPQPLKLARAALAGTADRIAQMSKETWQPFEADAKALVEKCNCDATEAVARTLAMLARVPEKGEAPSLLSGTEGHTTVLMRTRTPPPHRGFALACLRDYLPEGSAREICLCPEGAVFDLPCRVVQSVISQGPYRSVLGFEILEDLPEGVAIPSMDDIAHNNDRRGNFGSGGSHSTYRRSQQQRPRFQQQQRRRF